MGWKRSTNTSLVICVDWCLSEGFLWALWFPSPAITHRSLKCYEIEYDELLWVCHSKESKSNKSPDWIELLLGTILDIEPPCPHIGKSYALLDNPEWSTIPNSYCSFSCMEGTWDLKLNLGCIYSKQVKWKRDQHNSMIIKIISAQINKQNPNNFLLIHPPNWPRHI